MEHVVKLVNVEVRRSGQPILKDVTWTVDAGQNWVILGPNGAGKTTLVNLLTGRVFPSYDKDNPSEAKVLDYRLGRVDLSELRTIVGMATSGEEHLIPRRLPILDILLSALYGKTYRGREEYEEQDLQRAMDLLHIFGIAQLAERDFQTLSEGERQRVIIARALMTDPEILVLDEPTAGQDWAHYTEIMEFLKSLNDAGITIVLITHDMHLTLEYTDRAIVMSDGRVIAEESSASVLADPELTKAASLRTTSLYDLALRVGEQEALGSPLDPTAFIEQFIARENQWREDVLAEHLGTGR